MPDVLWFGFIGEKNGIDSKEYKRLQEISRKRIRAKDEQRRAEKALGVGESIRGSERSTKVEKPKTQREKPKTPKKGKTTKKKKEKIKENSARLTAGFCWKWSSRLDAEGNLVKDVKIGDFEMPWETHFKIRIPPPGYVKWYEWAYKPEGIKQVGCIYTAQGFEFDYIGVIFGDDLQYRRMYDKLIGDFASNKDPQVADDENFESYIRNIYRVLMTRGLKGCYVYFVNKETEEYFRRFIEK